MFKRFTQIGIQLVFLILMFLPAFFWYGLKTVINPVGFWQNFVVAGVGLYFLGAIQIAFVVLGVVVSILLWSE